MLDPQKVEVFCYTHNPVSFNGVAVRDREERTTLKLACIAEVSMAGELLL